MRKFLTLLLLFIACGGKAQRADGFFIQDLAFIDPYLIKKNLVDKIIIELHHNRRKLGFKELLLDSNSRLITVNTVTNDSSFSINFSSARLTQFACPSSQPPYIKKCEAGVITETASNGAYRFTTFNDSGQVVRDRWKPGASYYEIDRTITYDSQGLVDTITIRDVKSSGEISKKELHIYSYNFDRLRSITQMIDRGIGYENGGNITFKNYDCGLVKKMDGKANFDQTKMRIDFKYYSKGNLLK